MLLTWLLVLQQKILIYKSKVSYLDYNHPGSAKQRRMEQTKASGSDFRIKIVLLAITTGFFIVGFVLNLTSDQSLYNYDLEVVPQMQENSSLASKSFIVFMNLVSNIFNPVICAGYVIIFYLISYRKLQILVFLVWFIFLSFLLSVLKQLIQQPRPYWIATPGQPQVQMLEWTCYSEYGCPSGHAMLGIVLMEFIVRFFARVHKCVAKYIPVFYLLIVALQLLVMFSRVILGMHTFNEVIFGVMIGVYSFVPYYLFIENWLLKRIVRLFQTQKDASNILLIIIFILLSFILEICITYLPVYQTSEYLSVIITTSGCQNVKPSKSFQFKCFEDSSLIMAAFGALLAFSIMEKPASLVKMLTYPRCSKKYVAKFVIMVVLSLIPIAILLNPLWTEIDLQPGYLALVIWACQTIGFFISMLVLIAFTPNVTDRAGLETFLTPASLSDFNCFQVVSAAKGKGLNASLDDWQQPPKKQVQLVDNIDLIQGCQ